ncbi:transposase [Spirosoma arboris]|uniref:transposase n=1 Tax=Spirosoma arboris TaxID=2682092 RepID=UPI0018DB65CE|nr:transposase [Spirosoma arboris]
MPRLEVIAADAGYKLNFIEHVEANGWRVEIAQKPEGSRGFVPEKNRWPVERSFGWFNFRRRLFRDVEKSVESSEAMLQLAFISIIINRLAK